MFWGHSEALDLLAEYRKHVIDRNPLRPQPEQLNILLFGAGDPRHILYTMAAHRLATVAAKTAGSAPPPRLAFYTLDGCPELMARNIVLLALALEPAEEMCLKSRSHMFMDLYGNSLLRPSSHLYVCSKARHFEHWLTDFSNEQTNATMPLFDIGRLKYRDRDALADVFRFWLNRPRHRFDMADYWQERVRRDLGVRYDARAGMFDWDLNMRLRDNGVQRCCPQEYKHWRETGVAFAYPEYEQTVPNKTLAAGLMAHGDGFAHRGYLGDIRSGPFVTFGEKCVDERLLRSAHGTNAFRSTEITERNLVRAMYELQRGEAYTMNVGDCREFGGSMLQLGKHMSAESALLDEERDRHRFDRPMDAEAVGECRVHLMSAADVLAVSKRDEFRQFFDVVFVGHAFYSFLDASSFASMLRPEALCMFESCQLQVLRQPEIDAFTKKCRIFAKGQRLRAITHFHLNLKPAVLRFVPGLTEEEAEVVQVEEEKAVEKATVVDGVEESTRKADKASPRKDDNNATKKNKESPCKEGKPKKKNKKDSDGESSPKKTDECGNVPMEVSGNNDCQIVETPVSKSSPKTKSDDCPISKLFEHELQLRQQMAQIKLNTTETIDSTINSPVNEAMEVTTSDVTE